jgi:PAS domain S-box-containing protein
MPDNQENKHVHSPPDQLNPIDELQQLYDLAPCGYHSLDANGVFMRINQTELTMFGYSRAEIIGKKKFSELLTAASQQLFIANFPIFKQRGWIRDLEFYIICKNGQILPISLSATAINDAAGNYVMSRSIVVDISERVRLEAERQQASLELQNSENRYRLLFESNPNPMWIYDPETLALIEVNQAAIDHYGYSQSEFLKLKICDLQLTTEVPAVQPIGIHQPSILIWKHRRQDGSIIDVEVMDHNCLVAGKQVNLALIKDITALHQIEVDRINAEAALRSAHQSTLTVWESMTDAYVTIDQEWRFIYANQAAVNVITQLSGIQPAEVLTKTHWEIFPSLAGGELEQRYRQALADQTPAHFEFIYEPTGNWFELHIYPSEIGLGLYFRDITDRKQAEQKINEQANLLSIATDAIFVYDIDQRVLFWNRGAEQLYGWAAAEIIGQDWRESIGQNALPEWDLILPALITHGTWQGEVPKVTESGKTAIVMSRCSLMRDEAGQPKSILTVDTDITERKQLEKQFLRAQRLESLGMLASGIAHDLNNVLTPIIGIVQLLPHKIPDLDEQTQRLLQVLDTSANRGADLVKQILAFTRGVEGKPVTTQISHIIAEIQKIIRQTFPKNIELELELAPKLWQISADVTMLHQVLLNLCVNARDAMPNGGTICIQAENVEIDKNYARMHLDAQIGDYLVVTIADTGAGIPAEIIDRIFDPFFTTKEIGKGTGLGLSTVMGIIKSHHGFVTVYSEVGKGTRFQIYLPATDTHETESIATVLPPRGQNQLILVVDDETAIQEITKATLEVNGYRVVTASDGIEAIAIYAEQKREIAVVLLDLMMPLLDSLTIVRTLSKINPQIKIVTMSGLATNESVTKTMTAGVSAFLAKPFTALELLNLLAKLCPQAIDQH